MGSAACKRRSRCPRGAVVEAQRSPLRCPVAQRSTAYSLCATVFKDASESDADSRERGRRGYTFNVTRGRTRLCPGVRLQGEREAATVRTAPGPCPRVFQTERRLLVTDSLYITRLSLLCRMQ